jgi:hypothetical protein
VGGHLQLLQVAVCNVVATPIRDRIELDAVGELHLVVLPNSSTAFSLGSGSALLVGRSSHGLLWILE